MSELKEKVFAMLNAWTTCETSGLQALVDPAFVEIDPPQQDVLGLAGLQEKIQDFHRAHSQVSLRVISQIAEKDRVCTKWMLMALAGADGGDGGDPARIPVLLTGISWTYFAQGKIVKNRVYRDIVGYLMQRGFRWDDPTNRQAAQPEGAR